jgi:hypothetical protein
MGLLNTLFRKQPVERPEGDALSVAVKDAGARTTSAAKRLADTITDLLDENERIRSNNYWINGPGHAPPNQFP